jgi:hypothetical protein
MAVAQITARLPAEAKLEFRRYAEALGLDASELAKLLIVRERYQKQLLRLVRADKVAERSRRGSSGRLETITAHLSSLEDVESFDAYAEKCGLSRSSAAAHILEAEIREHWLEKAIKA